MEDATKITRGDHLLGLRYGGNATVIVADHVDHARLLYGLEHGAGFLDRHGERLFAEDMLAGLRGGDGDFSVGIIRRVDVDDVDLGICDDFAPIRCDMLPAKFFGGGPHAFFITTADGVQYGLGGNRKEMSHLAPRVRMGLAHEFVADHPNV